MSVGPGELLAAVSYMTDIVPDGCFFHSWRVALLGRHIASRIAPDIQRDVFYAGLLQEVGSVGSSKHITECKTIQQQMQDPYIRIHPQRGAALLKWLPGMELASEFVKSHHEWWDGSGYPDRISGSAIPVGSQILNVSEAADIAGCFNPDQNLTQCLRSLALLTGYTWSKDMFAALVDTTKDAQFFRTLMDTSALPKMIHDTLTELGVPDGLATEQGVERVLHIFAALIDVKDPSTNGHSLRVARYAKALAEHMGLPEEEVRTAYRAGLVHDCGRLGVPTLILNMSGRMNENDMNIVRKHAKMTIRILSCVPDYPDMAELGEIAGHDHERCDGDGYPDKLSGENIPLVSRVLSAVDAFDSMISTTTYRLLSPRCAVLRIQQASGTQFDPAVVDAMTTGVQSGVFT